MPLCMIEMKITSTCLNDDKFIYNHFNLLWIYFYFLLFIHFFYVM